MKKAIILHGTNGDPKENWFDWLKIELEKNDWNVWVPDLRKSATPNPKIYNPHITENLPWKLDKNTIFIGHSSGAVSILNYLQTLSEDKK